MASSIFFFFQAEDGIRDADVTGVQTCALPICPFCGGAPQLSILQGGGDLEGGGRMLLCATCFTSWPFRRVRCEIGRASGRGRGEISGVAGSLKKKKEKSTCNAEQL